MTTQQNAPGHIERCPRCGSEAWPIAYGMVLPSVMEENPRMVYAGCVMTEGRRLDPATGELQRGTPEWECQAAACGYRWW